MRVCIGCVLARSARACVRIGVVDGLHTMRGVQWRLTVLCVCVCVRMLFLLVAVAACWCILAMRPDYARFRL